MATKPPLSNFHQEILAGLKKYSRPEPLPNFNIRYRGTHSPCFGIKTPDHRHLIKQLVKSHSDFSLDEYIKLFNFLTNGKYHEEKTSIGMILNANPKLANQINSALLDEWLTNAEGWLEVDSLCQSSFNSKILLGNWGEWKNLLVKFSRNKLISKRRASLVLLVKPVSQSPDPQLSDLAFSNINNLKIEKDILITKAISWLLRALTKYHSQEVEDYLKQNSAMLPKIAIRETLQKLQTGKKSK